MAKLLNLVLLLFVGAIVCQAGKYQVCVNDFTDYMENMQKYISQGRRYKQFEKEFKDDYVELVKSCTSPTRRKARKDGLCILKKSDLRKDPFGRDSILADCQFCRNVVNKIKDAFLSLDKKVAKCFREQLSLAVRKEMNSCVGPKLGDEDFEVGPLPDFDEKLHTAREEAVETTKKLVTVASALGKCKLVDDNFNFNRLEKTTKCLRDPPAGHLKKHCQMFDYCGTFVSQKCKKNFNEAQVATCECLDEKKELIQGKLSKVKKVLRNVLRGERRQVGFSGSRRPAVGSTQYCVQEISRLLFSVESNVDWKLVLNDALKCTDEIKTNFNGLLRIGCSALAEFRGSNKAQRDLQIGFNFINNVVNAFAERLGRFCRNEHCRK